MRDILLPKGMCSESRDLTKFRELSDNMLKRVQDRHIAPFNSMNAPQLGADPENIML